MRDYDWDGAFVALNLEGSNPHMSHSVTGSDLARLSLWFLKGLKAWVSWRRSLHIAICPCRQLNTTEKTTDTKTMYPLKQ